MTDSIVFFLYSSLLALVIGIIWILVKHYNPRLSRIDDELHGVTVMLKELTQQLCKITSMLEEVSKSEITKTDIENTSRVTNDYLGKMLWQMRFDEAKYAESMTTTGNGTVVEPGNAKVNNINKQRGDDREALDGTKSMKAILKNEGDDDCSSILKYMTRTDKDGTNALHVLDDVRDSRIR